ncbi:MAG: hypothetical protein KF708_08195 [Pirellulales bacterium]|nr:hypothetical protein [Pirellulales bacterium]
MNVAPKNLRIALLLLLGALLGGGVPAVVRAGSAAAPNAGDDAAADSLDDELLKELEDTPPPSRKPASKAAPAAQPPASKPDDKDEAAPAGRETDPLDEELMRELGEGEQEQAGEENRLGRVARTMREVENRLTRSKTDQETRELQTKIVSDLEQMIDEAMKQAKRSKSKSSSSGSSGEQQARRSKPEQAQQENQQKQQGEPQDDRPASDSTERLRADRALRPDPGQVRERMKHLWGHLPEREREMMLNASIEQFLPKYELLIEQYFRRLAEEQPQK